MLNHRQNDKNEIIKHVQSIRQISAVNKADNQFSVTIILQLQKYFRLKSEDLLITRIFLINIIIFFILKDRSPQR